VKTGILGKAVRKAHEKGRGAYGARRIRQELAEDGEPISRTHVGRLMKRQGQESKSKRKLGVTVIFSYFTTC